MAEVFSVTGITAMDLGNVVAGVEGSACVIDDASNLDGTMRTDSSHYTSQCPSCHTSTITVLNGTARSAKHIRDSEGSYNRSMLKKEAKPIIICDCVLSEAANFSDLGFSAEDYKGN
ncbi:hypothetical protein BBP40_008557 [Aspergillus hancockii]|nr:hypothetical protein BBP40_008557 [Aspergillus hancockii]